MLYNAQFLAKMASSRPIAHVRPTVRPTVSFWEKTEQLDLADAAVASGAASVGIPTSNGVVLAAEKKWRHPMGNLSEDHSTYKIEKIADHICMVYSGMDPDYRLLVERARKMSQDYQFMFEDEILPRLLAQRLAAVIMERAESGGKRPFGVSLLIAGWYGRGYEGPNICEIHPCGRYFEWGARAIGRISVNGMTVLEERCGERLELENVEDAVRTAILTLSEGFEGQMTEDNVEIAVCDANGFKRFTPEEIKHYLTNIHDDDRIVTHEP